MTHPTPLIRFRHLLVVGAVVAGATASTAGALIPQPEGDSAPAGVQLVSRPPDVQDAATAAQQTTAAGLKADGMRWAGTAKVYQSLQATHQFGGRLAVSSTAAQSASRPPDIRDTSSSLSASAPDMVERYAAVHAQDVSSSSAGATRPPDVSDTALAVRYGSTASVSQSNGFDWNDWAIGIGSGLGLALILGAALLMGRQLRHPVQAA